MNRPPIRSWLYAPGNNPKLLGRVLETETDAAILDLEDSVPPASKADARNLVAQAVTAHAGKPAPAIFVRINHPETGLARDDTFAAVRPGITGLRVPKMESARQVRMVAEWVDEAERVNGVEPGTVVLVLGIETAAGLWRAVEIGGASERVLSFAFGAVDFCRDTNITIESNDDRELLYARSKLVIASRIAGISPPIDTVYINLDDPEGLEQRARAARALGFFGKSAIHPRQLETINRVFTPSRAEIDRALEIIAAAQEAEDHGIGALRLPTGEFVDVPVVQRAEAVVRLAEQLGVLEG